MDIIFGFIWITTLLKIASGVYDGKGEAHFSRMYRGSNLGFRMVYRPENYQTYMAYGGALQSHFKGHIYKTTKEMNKNYHNDIFADWTSWEILSWDCKGNYYYYEDSTIDIRYGELIAYGIVIYDQNSKETYTDINYWKVKGNFVYCELDERAEASDQTCSTVLANGGRNSEKEIRRRASIIAPATLIPTMLIFVVIGVCMKTRRGNKKPSNEASSNSDSSNTEVRLSQLQQPNRVVPPREENTASDPPPYQTVSSPPVIFQPPPPAVACHPASLQPPSYESVVAKPAVIQPTMIV
ncbi:uncharacterized protein [Watersipora subatra]|uniref:uncharacterized protein isoform X1 n=1 Tax=Watersipora subatra TaxID=2589382 RepID=UPI00355BE8B9